MITQNFSIKTSKDGIRRMSPTCRLLKRAWWFNVVLWRWAMRWEGWERLGNWHSEQLMSTLCRKIRSIWCYKPKYEPLLPPQTMWELICLGQGGPRLADPEDEIITPEVETPSGLLQERRQQRWEVDQEALLTRHLEVQSWPLVQQSADQGATFQTFYPPTEASWGVHKGQMSSSQPVWRNEGIFEAIVPPPLADSLWFEPPWVTATLILLQVTRSLFLLSSFKSGGPAKAAAWGFKVGSLMGGKPWLSVNVALSGSN